MAHCACQSCKNVRSWAGAYCLRDDVCSHHVYHLQRDSVTGWRVDHSNIQDCLNTLPHPIYNLNQASCVASHACTTDVWRVMSLHIWSMLWCHADVLTSLAFSLQWQSTLLKRTTIQLSSFRQPRVHWSHHVSALLCLKWRSTYVSKNNRLTHTVLTAYVCSSMSRITCVTTSLVYTTVCSRWNVCVYPGTLHVIKWRVCFVLLSSCYCKCWTFGVVPTDVSSAAE